MMRHTCNNLQSENLIDRYISASGNSKSKAAEDDIFARPIEDEDLFSVFPSDTPKEAQDPTLTDLIDSDQENTNNVDSNIIINEEQAEPDDLFNDDLEDEIVGLSDLRPMQTNEKIDVDEIFLDDYSQSSDAHKFKQGAVSYENGGYIENNIEQQVAQAPPAPEPSPAQLKNQRMKERILQQLKAKSIVHKKITDIDDDGMIEVMGQHSQPVSDHNTKFIFNKLFNKSKKATDHTPEKGKPKWESYKDALRKQICSQKRKIWDSFQTATDEFDEDEEFIGEPGDDVNQDDIGEDLDDDEDNPVAQDMGNSEDDEGGSDDDGEGDQEQFEDEEMADEDEDEDIVPKKYRITEDDDDDNDDVVEIDNEHEEAGDELENDEDDDGLDLDEEDDDGHSEAQDIPKKDRMILSEAEEDDNDSDDQEEEETTQKTKRKVIFESDSD